VGTQEDIARAIADFNEWTVRRINSGMPDFLADGHSFRLCWFGRGARTNRDLVFGPFGWSASGDSGNARVPAHTYYQLTLPFWLPTLVFASYPTIVCTRSSLRSWRRRRGHKCPACGYDLTGNVSGRCPECGRPVAPRHK
jgi:hypothetical protein